MKRSGFAGFPNEAVVFFQGLARNNNRDWFLPRKPLFDEKVKAPMRELVAALNEEMKSFAPEYCTDPEKAIYRFYRDTRFSKDKKPYKDHIAAYFARRGHARHEGAGYYFAVSHKEVAVGGGVYMPLPETLLAIRQHISQRHEEFRRIVTSRGLRKLLGEMQGEQLARAPKGFDPKHPAADILKHKQFLFYAQLPPEVATSRSLLMEVRKRFEAMTPFIEFLDAALPKREREAPDPRPSIR